MRLGEFIEKFRHNNLIRLVYKDKSGHQTVLPTWDDVSMDWEVNKKIGKFKNFINNEVVGIASIYISGGCKYPEAINIVIKKMDLKTRREKLKNIINNQYEKNKIGRAHV